MDLTGFDNLALEELMTAAPPESDPPMFTRKIEVPIYEPSGEKPEVAVLFDAGKTTSLLQRIDAADIPADVREFLTLAAHRHTVFDFSKVADFYAHSGPEIQRLMEDSALIIIDFNKAIEDGYVILSEHIRQTYCAEVAADE